LFVHVLDTLIWLTKTPAEFLRWEGPVADNTASNATHGFVE